MFLMYLLDRKGRKFYIPEKEETIIGRNGDIKIPEDVYGREQISRQHCLITRYDLGKSLEEEKTRPLSFLSVRDLNSKNGTYYREFGKEELGKVTEREVFLHNNDEIFLGPYCLKVKIKQETQEAFKEFHQYLSQ